MGKIFIIGICGGSASGKSQLAKRINAYFTNIDIVSVSMDNYYKDFPKSGIDPQTVNYDDPETINIDLFFKHLHLLKQGRTVKTPVYDYVSHQSAERIQILRAAKVVIVEGLFIFHFREILGLCDYKIFINIPLHIRLSRRIKRDIRERGRGIISVLRQFYSNVNPMHNKFIMPGIKYADFILEHKNQRKNEYAELFKSLEKSLMG